MSIDLSHDNNNLKNQFKRIQDEIDKSFKLIETKLAKVVSENKNNIQVTKDFENLKKILEETEKSLYEIKNIMKLDV